MDIACAAELKQKLLEALSSGREVRLLLARATHLDLTAAQLLWAAEREANRLGMGFRMAGEMPASVSTTLAEMGLDKLCKRELDG